MKLNGPRTTRFAASVALALGLVFAAVAVLPADAADPGQNGLIATPTAAASRG